MQAGIRIKVGCAVDRDVGNAFKPIVAAAKAARQAVETEMDRAWAAVNGKGAVKTSGGGPYRSVVREAERAATQIVSIETRKQERIKRQQEAAQRYVQRIRDRHFAQQQRDEERAERIAAKKASADSDKARKENVGRLRAVGGGT